MKKFVLTLLISAFFVSSFTVSSVRADYHMNHVGTITTSGNYPWGVAIGEVINKYAEGVTCKTRAVGAGGVTLPMIQRGQANMGSALGIDRIIEAYHGVRQFQKMGPNRKLRLLTVRELTYSVQWVTVSSGIKNYIDLKGRKINRGNPGSSADAYSKAIDEVLGTGAVWALGSTSKAKQDISDRRIDGYWRSAPAVSPGPDFGLKFDASALELNAFIPMTVCGLTEDQKNKVRAKHPWIKFSKVPAGKFVNQPKMSEFWLPINPTFAAVTSDVPQDVQYKIIKAIVEHWQEICDAYPPSREWDPIKDTLAQGDFGIPMCAGLVQYAKEKGIRVPMNVIPVEYKER